MGSPPKVDLCSTPVNVSVNVFHYSALLLYANDLLTVLIYRGFFNNINENLFSVLDWLDRNRRSVSVSKSTIFPLQR